MTEASQQIAFDLPHRPAYGREDFFVSESNEEAVTWIDRYPDWPASVLVLHGPKSSGKTHLLSVWQKKAEAVPFDPAVEAADARAVYIDDIEQYFGDEESERALFHLYNILQEGQGHMLMTSAFAPGAWEITLPDLKSRLLAAPSIALQAPDEGLLAAVLLKLFVDRQLNIGQEVLSFLLPRMHRSLEAAEKIVDAVDRLSLEQKRNITVPLVKQVFEVEN